jgi:hypothetical protein
LQPGYVRSPAGRFGGSGADRDSYRRIDANIDTDADRNFYRHINRDALAYYYFYCHTDADGDADFYGHTCSNACPERSRRADAYGYFYRHTRTDSDSCPTYGHADASVSVPTRWAGPAGHVASLSRVPQGTGLHHWHSMRHGGQPVGRRSARLLQRLAPLSGSRVERGRRSWSI